MIPHTGALAFYGDKLRLARLLASMSLDELGGLVAASRQYVHQLETGAKDPSAEMRAALAAVLGVRDSFFAKPSINPVREDDCHFRKLMTAPRTVMAQAAARGTLVEMLVAALDKRLRLPRVDFPDLGRPANLDEAERIAEGARSHWQLGVDAPITSMTRVVENAGAVVVHFDDISDRIDALSIARRRPIIVRSSAKTAAVRLRFDLAHECGHLVMHQGLITGDRETEDEAHRFAGAFLLPGAAFAKEFPRARRGLDWAGLYQMKLRWKVSVRAIVRRAYDLKIIDPAQYRTANVHLTKTGQAKTEYYDDMLEPEAAELLTTALLVLSGRDAVALHGVLDELGVEPELFKRTTGHSLLPLPENVLAFSRRGERLL
jgi:Zn-dependent peptidase ImmA (M78 family)/transcriptional regulator with XRE-family HTH domain